MAKSSRTCEHCKVEFLAENKFINKGIARFCSKNCRVLGFKPVIIEKIPNLKCSYCDKEFYRKDSGIKASRSGFHFCSRICKQEAQKSRKIVEVVPAHYGNNSQTKGGLYELRGGRTQGRSTLSRLARSTYVNSSLPKHCVYCGYDTHYEVCHIRPVSDFPPEALVSDINAMTNLVALCPNHHWELDNGKLQWFDIVEKMTNEE